MVRQKLRHDMLEMLLAENHEMIQALLLKRLDKSLDIGNRARRISFSVFRN